MLFADLQLQYEILKASPAYAHIQKMALVYYPPARVISEYSIPGYLAVIMPGQDWTQHTKIKTINEVNAFIAAHP
jgi:hypothetical protein